MLAIGAAIGTGGVVLILTIGAALVRLIRSLRLLGAVARVDEPVAGAGLGQQVARPRTVRLDLAPEL